MKNHTLIASIASLGAFSLLVSSGFAVWTFADGFEIEDIEPVTSSKLYVTPKVEVGDLTLVEPSNHLSYRIVFDQGGMSDEEIASNDKGVYLNTPLVFTYTNYYPSDLGDFYVDISIIGGSAFSTYAELTNAQDGYQRINITNYTEITDGITFTLEPTFSYKEGKKPHSSTEWSALMKDLDNKTIQLGLNFYFYQ